MHELQDVGGALVRLRADQLERIELPEALREAVVHCRGLTKHEAVRRQMQYIGKLMRRIDAAPIVAQLESMHAPSHRQTAQFHEAERWRTQMLAAAEAVDRFVLEHPRADGKRLRELAALAGAERRAEQPPKRFRELFQVINAVLQEDGKQGE